MAYANYIEDMEINDTTYGVRDKDHREDTSLHITTVATTTANGLMSYTDKTKLDGISTGSTAVEASETNGNILIDDTETTVYTLPAATDSVRGGIKLLLSGTTLNIITTS